ncbi:MAG TPA: hypothetical protein PLV76_08910, partial [Spirochaetales bacterium]|nr:hypothetical protein [Spirochaetales bacterium]
MMKKRCEICQEPFVVGDDDLAFLLKLAPKFHGKNYPFPEPQSCPNCRLRARLSFRNQIYVYSRKSSKSGEQVFSMYPDDSPFPVYAHDEWWSDSWDAADYGQEFDFSRPFFAQFAALAQQVPSFPLSVLKCENSSYSNHCTSVRNCYLVFNTSNAEDCMYCENAFGSRDCTDCTHTPYSELCYDCIQCGRCYALQSSICCEHCSDSYFLFNCTGCRNCFGCVNLRRAEYRIFNEQKTRDEYHAFISSLPLDSFAERSRLRRQCEEFFRLHPRPHIDSKMTEHVTGNLIFEAKNVFDSCLVRGAENCKYVYNAVHGVKDCYDFSCFGNGAELLYACVS